MCWDFIAGSVNTKPVVIRRIMGMLKMVGLVEVGLGVEDASLLKAPKELRFLMWAANLIEESQLFRFQRRSE